MTNIAKGKEVGSSEIRKAAEWFSAALLWDMFVKSAEDMERMSTIGKVMSGMAIPLMTPRVDMAWLLVIPAATNLVGSRTVLADEMAFVATSVTDTGAAMENSFLDMFFERLMTPSHLELM